MSEHRRRAPGGRYRWAERPEHIMQAERSPHYVPAGEPSQQAAGIRPYPFLEWHRLIGAIVEVRREGVFPRTGFVEDITPSGDTAWIAADGIDRRIMIEKSARYELWISAEQLQPRSVRQPRR